jgi:putative endonuclease
MSSDGRGNDLQPRRRQLRKCAGREGALTRRELGLRAELAVAEFLFASGFSILARNLRLGPLELDVVARNGPLVVVVEVRTRARGGLVGPFQSITKAKRARLIRGVDRLWRTWLCADAGVNRVRIDVAAVIFDGERTIVEYVRGAVVA